MQLDGSRGRGCPSLEVGGGPPLPAEGADAIELEECRGESELERHLLELPAVFCISLVWPSATTTAATIAAVLGAGFEANASVDGLAAYAALCAAPRW